MLTKEEFKKNLEEALDGRYYIPEEDMKNLLDLNFNNSDMPGWTFAAFRDFVAECCNEGFTRAVKEFGLKLPKHKFRITETIKHVVEIVVEAEDEVDVETLLDEGRYDDLLLEAESSSTSERETEFEINAVPEEAR